MRFLFSCCLLCLSCAFMSAQDRVSLLHEGDLLFCLSAEENQITKVTEGIDGSRIDHVGIVNLRVVHAVNGARSQRHHHEHRRKRKP